MKADRTELEWTYTPADLFEAPFERDYPSFGLTISDGKAVAVLKVPHSDSLEREISNQVRAFIQVREMLVHRPACLEGPAKAEFIDGVRKNVSLMLRGEMLKISGGILDLIVKDGNGNVIRDSKAERIAAETAELERIVLRASHRPLLFEMLASYVKAINDPSNELIYLYEVGDLLKKHFGSKERAQTALLISSAEWKKLGRLANVDPLEQGRHRGQHPEGRRPATPEELATARRLVRSWIGKFAELPDG